MLPTIQKGERLIHLIWFNLGKGDVPHGKYLEGYNAWLKFNPSSRIILWSRDMVELLLQQSKYLFFRPSWERLRMTIQQLDMARPIILDKYGGLYGDLDFVCTRSVDSLFAFHETYKERIILMKSHKINAATNSFYLGYANHPFWMFYLLEAVNSIRNWKWARENSYWTIMNMTGPPFLNRTISRFGASHFIQLDPSQLFALPHEYIPSVSFGLDHLASDYGVSKPRIADVQRVLLIVVLVIGAVLVMVKVLGHVHKQKYQETILQKEKEKEEEEPLNTQVN